MFPVFVDSVLRSHQDFDTWVPAAERLTVECSRPKFVWARVLHYFRLAYGVEGPERVIERDQLEYLFVEADGFDIGVRNKKLSRRSRSYNHPSNQQDRLRRDQRFPYNETTAHVFLGYRFQRGLQARVTHILLTCGATHRIVWRHLLWSIDGGIQPIRPIHPLFPPAPPPAEAPLRAKPRKKRPGGEKGGTAEQESG